MTWICLLYNCQFFECVGQPVLSTKMTVAGFDVYQDHVQKNTWYYSPPDVAIKTASSGAPAFLLLQMRYTGTRLYGDQEQKGFHNMLQLSIVLEPLSTPTYDLIVSSIGRSVDLRPIPVSKFFGELIMPLGDAAAANEKYRKVSMSGVEASGSPVDGNAFWLERTFTLQLENYEAQLLWDQVETGKLGVSFSYAFYSNAIPGKIGDISASGTNEELADAVEGIREEVTFDENVNTYFIKGNTFPIEIDENDFPSCLKKVDVNEEMPPAYAAFEVRCYDFTEDLRPDLFKKIVEIKAYAAGKAFITTKAEFSRNNKDLNGVIARFPYAIRLDQPLEYRVTELNANGEKVTGPWIEVKNWSEVIDVTTKGKENLIAKRSLDFEIPMDSLSDNGLKEIRCVLLYKLNHNDIQQTLTWKQNEQETFKSISFSYDKAVPIRYRVVKIQSDDSSRNTPFRNIQEKEDYVYLNLREN